MLTRWDERNQRIVERQNRNELQRTRELAELRFHVTLPDGKRLTIWAQPTGYPYRFADGGADALDFVILPVMWAVARLRHHYQFHGGWSVAVLRKGRVFERIVLLERYASKDQATARAALLGDKLGTALSNRCRHRLNTDPYHRSKTDPLPTVHH